ncbi:MAG: hypothetical protein HY078_01285 [Elusimicrobia bacterium]|nr:hypothetical protein [Elusimicrobiota bacterium]
MRRDWRKRAAAWAGAGALLLAAAYGALSETLTMTTYYPSPLGVYHRLTARWMDFNPFAKGLAAPGVVCLNGDLAAPCLRQGASKPEPGQLFYNSDKDQFYYSSKSAEAADPTTWYRPMSGIDNRTVSAGRIGSFSTTSGGFQRMAGWTPDGSPAIGTAACSGQCMATAQQTASGLYVVELSGMYCSPAHTPPTDLDARPSFRLQWRYPGGTWRTVVTAAEDLTLNAPGGCAEFSFQSMFFANYGKIIQSSASIKRETAGDSVSNVQLTVSRVLKL